MTGRRKHDWAAIEAAFVANGESVSAIGRRFGVSPSQIYRKARAGGWLRGRAGHGSGDPSSGGHVTAVSALAPAVEEDDNQSAHAPDRHSRTAIAVRMRRMVETQLLRLEERMADGDDATSTDQERDARALGGLIRNLEKLMDLDKQTSRREADFETDGDPREGCSYDSDPETVRRVLAERILSLRKRMAVDD